MKLQDILVIMQNRILSLNEARKLAVNSGNIEQIGLIDSDLLSTQNTIKTIEDSLK
jgi:hypothetical protein